MPEDKFNFAPTQGEFKGVRTFAQQVKHIAAANYMLGAGILAEKPPMDLEGENGPAKITSKADIVQFLKDSFTYLHKALNSIDENNVLEQVPSPFGPNKVTRLGLAIGAISHPNDHYGQMVEYLRDEQHHSSGQPAAEVVSSHDLATIREKARAIALFLFVQRVLRGTAAPHVLRASHFPEVKGCIHDPGDSKELAKALVLIFCVAIFGFMLACGGVPTQR